MASSIYLVTCSDMMENTHVIGVFDLKAEADAFAAAPHDKVACPRSWVYGTDDFVTSEAHAATLMGGPRTHEDHAVHIPTGHELSVVRLSLTGPRLACDNRAWVLFALSPNVGEVFECSLSRAFTSKTLALAFLRLPPTAEPPTRDGGADSPLDDFALQGDGRTLLRPYPVKGW